MSLEGLPEQVPCGVYEHYKGGRYYVLGLGRDDCTEEPVVVYCRLYSRIGIPLNVRRASEFFGLEDVQGEQVQRFRYVGLQEEDVSPYKAKE